MKFAATLTLVIASALLIAADAPTAVTYLGHARVTEALAKGGAMVTAPNLIVQGGHREKAGQVEVHDSETDVIYVQDGEATFVTGGKMIGGKLTKPGQYLGTEIQG